MGERLVSYKKEGVIMPVRTQPYQPKKKKSHVLSEDPKYLTLMPTFQGAEHTLLTEDSVRNTTLPGELFKPTQLLAFQLF